MKNLKFEVAVQIYMSFYLWFVCLFFFMSFYLLVKLKSRRNESGPIKCHNKNSTLMETFFFHTKSNQLNFRFKLYVSSKTFQAYFTIKHFDFIQLKKKKKTFAIKICFVNENFKWWIKFHTYILKKQIYIKI